MDLLEIIFVFISPIILSSLSLFAVVNNLLKNKQFIKVSYFRIIIYFPLFTLLSVVGYTLNWLMFIETGLLRDNWFVSLISAIPFIVAQPVAIVAMLVAVYLQRRGWEKKKIIDILIISILGLLFALQFIISLNSQIEFI